MHYIFKRKSSQDRMYHGILYTCNHPVYNGCTLYLIGDNGLAVIQQRYDSKTKQTWWEELDDDLAEEIYQHEKFPSVFLKWSGPGQCGLFPTLTVRQIMWALKMKPLPKEPWETVFDHKPI